MDANKLRQAFTDFFVQKGHVYVPSASLIPNDPSLLFTVAGMVPFKPYFLGYETPPYSRATSVQKCFRTPDIDLIGTTSRHLTFFEMLGNFSFGDYFKEQAIVFAWELITEVLKLDPNRLWITVHFSDQDAADIWKDVIGIPSDRIQEMGEDNFWEMSKGSVGPCGPSSEIYYDKGESFGSPGGPAVGGQDRFVEIWNLVFMESHRLVDGSLEELPKKNIDTGAGLERILPIVSGVDSIFETDLFKSIIETGQDLISSPYGRDEFVDVSLRIMADHARSIAFLVTDGVFPSNEGRGYVLRRLIRRMVRRAQQLGVDKIIIPTLVSSAIDTMELAYPELGRSRDFIQEIASKEEERFRQTLKAGSAMLEAELQNNQTKLSGEIAFKLHDTFGFPIELTKEVAEEAGVKVDLEGFEAAMKKQRSLGRKVTKESLEELDGNSQLYRGLVESFGATNFVGYDSFEVDTRILAVLNSKQDPSKVEVFLQDSPFYAEGGGQIGDSGIIKTQTGTIRVTNTDSPLSNLHRHFGMIEQGEISPGQKAHASIDIPKRQEIRRNHSATHLLHWALRQVLGQHVRQQGSLVEPNRLRFDFTHFGPLTPQQVQQVEQLVNTSILANEQVVINETSKEQATQEGAIAFFGDKYGEVVRVVHAGNNSVELCGGTHVDTLGMIGIFKIVSESSIGSNTRRIEAVTGQGALDYIKTQENILETSAQILKTSKAEIPTSLEKLLTQRRNLEEQIKSLRSAQRSLEAKQLASKAQNGVLIERKDHATAEELRELALQLKNNFNLNAVVLVGTPDSTRVALVSAVSKTSGLVASDLILQAAKITGGGGGRQVEVAIAGGKDPSKIDEAIEAIRSKFDFYNPTMSASF